ncbi:hypothetical protein ACCAA_420030 [Candidatus Accumulibacter aalborgensis]|uniref:Uncharacterized protein n=1 Tax=Candidatus Accumulibacter aalborgensis TaxID=1860102 RepID=A0A1A8XQ92_9PROT|nr:hypothetical protein ACCAA_420030 [Candidatus Accumulibacter aalborgensis]
MIGEHTMNTQVARLPAAPFQNSAFVSRQTGRTHWGSSSHDLEYELTEETVDAAATTLTQIRCVYTLNAWSSLGLKSSAT